jgi:hypothetical protein
MITLYTNHCRKCEILTAKLREKNVDFNVIDDEQWLRDNGYDFMPVLEVDGNKLGFADAVSYVNAL